MHCRHWFLLTLTLVAAMKRAFPFEEEGAPKRGKYELCGSLVAAYRMGKHEQVREFLDSDQDHIVHEGLFVFFAEKGDVKLFKEMLAHPRLELNGGEGLTAFRVAVRAGNRAIARAIAEDGRLDISFLAIRLLKEHAIYHTIKFDLVKLLLRYVSPPMQRMIELAHSVGRNSLKITESLVVCLADTAAYPTAFTDTIIPNQEWVDFTRLLLQGDNEAEKLLELVRVCRTDSVGTLRDQYKEFNLFQIDFLLEASKRGKQMLIHRHLQELIFDSASNKNLEESKKWSLELLSHGFQHAALCVKAYYWALLKLETFRSHFDLIGFPSELKLELARNLYFEFL